MVFKIPADPTLPRLESVARQLARVPSHHPIALNLPRRLGARLLADGRVAAIIATAALRAERLVIVDHVADWAETVRGKGYGRTLPQLVALAYAGMHEGYAGNRLESARHERFPEVALAELRHLVRERGAWASEVAGGTERIAICWDPAPGEPIDLAGARRDFTVFWARIRDYRADLFGVGSAARASAIPRRFAEFLFELYKNSFDHGRTSVDGSTIPGIRYIRIRKYLDVSRSAMMRRVEGFEPLQSYIESLLMSDRALRGKTNLCEVTIADHGLGIVRKFLAGLPSDHPDQACEQRSLLNLILTTKRSSFGAADSGLGLQIALQAMREIRAFVSLRTGPFWMYRAFGSVGEANKLDLQHTIDSGELADLRGTHFSVLFPLMS